MIKLTPEQCRLLCLPEPSTFLPKLAKEVRRDYPKQTAALDDAALLDEVERSYSHAAYQFRITHLPTLVRWVKADVAFISVDVHARRADGKKGFEMYAGDRQLFPHRRWLGWMGFVPHRVEPRHIPEAAELIPVGDKGTVIVAVNECFDLHNPAHIKKAHEVEARMAFLGLLDVTDESLLK